MGLLLKLISLFLSVLLELEKDSPFVEGMQIEKILEQTMMAPNAGPDVLVTVLLVTMPPGDEGLPAHTHPGPAVVYVVEGEVLFQVNEELPEILPAGSIYYVNDGDHHVWDANASNATTCIVTATIFGRVGEEATTFLKDYKREDRTSALVRAQRKSK